MSWQNTIVNRPLIYCLWTIAFNFISRLQHLTFQFKCFSSHAKILLIFMSFSFCMESHIVFLIKLQHYPFLFVIILLSIVMSRYIFYARSSMLNTGDINCRKFVKLNLFWTWSYTHKEKIIEYILHAYTRARARVFYIFIIINLFIFTLCIYFFIIKK